MDLSKDLFLRYFGNKITQDELYVSIGVKDAEFEQFLLIKMILAYKQEDAEMIEYLIFTIFLAEDELNISSLLDILNKLILCKWHEKHEDIVFLLQKIRDSESVECLYQANQEAVNKLKLLVTSNNEIIRLCAERQLQKVQNSI